MHLSPNSPIIQTPSYPPSPQSGATRTCQQRCGDGEYRCSLDWNIVLTFKRALLRTTTSIHHDLNTHDHSEPSVPRRVLWVLHLGRKCDVSSTSQLKVILLGSHPSLPFPSLVNRGKGCVLFINARACVCQQTASCRG